ncbi:hypothetical protein SALBM135S_02167 [Streptomyces alboniger]
MHIDIPEGQDAIAYVWGEMVPEIGTAASDFSLAVYAHTSLGLREFEAARLRVAQINGCAFCLDWRTARVSQAMPISTMCTSTPASASRRAATEPP